MSARILDGNKIAADIRTEVAAELARFTEAGAHPPGLAAVLVGDHPASEIYVRNKIRACEQLGIFSERITPPAEVTTAELLAIVDGLNARDDIDGILVQLPLPKQVDARAVLQRITPQKDVDGFHALNIGLIWTHGSGLLPCTPEGIMEILNRSRIPIEGQYAVVVGRGEMVGRPTAMMLTNANATTTLCHSKTRNVAKFSREADILVVAVGRAAMVRKDWVKPGATVIDVGINRVTDPAEFERLFHGDAQRAEQFAKKGSTLVGDVHPEVAEVAGAITPVPGGVGPLTVAMLMVNTVKAAVMRRGARLAAVSK
jgi:methylenetetrahydrofolate dehydrogenase (NADP+)/methenyltetrahydrofolate cyclohydrolase